MTDTEKRRIELLEQTKKTYSDKYTPPAVHPRYRAAYQSIYKNDNNEEEESKNSTFFARTIIAVMLFGLFLLANYSKTDTSMIVNQIQKEFSVQEFSGLVDFPFFD